MLMMANLHKISEGENMPTRLFNKELTTSTASCVPNSTSMSLCCV